jgi:outer membrane protein assembly factor BamD (BamD/ComL family)
MLLEFPSSIQAQSREPRLIRDTDVAEGKDASASQAPKEPNPVLALQNLNIGNYYLKQKNYAAAIQRFLEAIEYQVDLLKAYDGLTEAYEKNGEIQKAVTIYKDFLTKNPDAPKIDQFRSRLAKLEKKIK